LRVDLITKPLADLYGVCEFDVEAPLDTL